MRKQSKKDPASHPGRRKTTTKTTASSRQRSAKGKTTDELMDKMLTDKNAKISEDEFRNIQLETGTGERISGRKKKPIEKISKPSGVQKRVEDDHKNEDDNKQVTPWNILG